MQPGVPTAPIRGRRGPRRAGGASRALLLVAVAVVYTGLGQLGATAQGFACSHAFTGLRRSPPFWCGAPRVARSATGSTEGDEFKAARDRIRRIQLGLGPNDPLPEEEGDAEAAEESVVPGEAKAKGELDLAEAGTPAEPVEAKVTEDTSTTDAKSEEAPPQPAADAYAGSLKDVEELKPEPTTKKDGPNFIEGLVVEAGLITLPSPGDVAQTFGTVLLLVALYTGFVAVVDYSSQAALGQVFADFYKAARPEAPSM